MTEMLLESLSGVDMKETKKWIFTFGSTHLTALEGKVRPLKVMLIVEAENERQARTTVFNSIIGDKFCTSYPYDKYAERFKREYNMGEYTLEQLGAML